MSSGLDRSGSLLGFSRLASSVEVMSVPVWATWGYSSASRFVSGGI
jgi:hypothetical protein